MNEQVFLHWLGVFAELDDDDLSVAFAAVVAASCERADGDPRTMLLHVADQYPDDPGYRPPTIGAIRLH